MADGIKWGENLERDCAELRRLEGWGLYRRGYHDEMCPLEDCPHMEEWLKGLTIVED